MKTFKIKKPKLISFKKKPLKKTFLNINFSFKILNKNDLDKDFYMIIYDIKLNKSENGNSNKNNSNIVYNRNNIIVEFNETEYKFSDNIKIIFYSNKNYKNLKINILSNILNRNKELFWDDNYSIKLFNILKLSKYLSRY